MKHKKVTLAKKKAQGLKPPTLSKYEMKTRGKFLTEEEEHSSRKADAA